MCIVHDNEVLGGIPGGTDFGKGTPCPRFTWTLEIKPPPQVPGNWKASPTCIGGDVAANAAAALGSKVEGHREAMGRDELVERLQNTARLGD